MKKPTRSLLGLGLAFCWWLGACAPLGYSVQDAHQHRVVADNTSVTVTEAGDEAHVRPYAEQYCDALGKQAQFKRLSKHRHARRYVYVTDVEFECVSAD
jgi:hypothetical protein